MARTRNKYHYAVRKVKKEADHIRAAHLLESAQKGEVHLLEEMKKINSKKANVSLPENVEGADNPDDIVDKFRTVYSNLYNSAPSAIQELWEALTVSDEATQDVKKITGAKVKEAACGMKPERVKYPVGT